MLTFLKNSQDEEIAKNINYEPGVGLAAPQLGIKKQIVRCHFVDENGKYIVMDLLTQKSSVILSKRHILLQVKVVLSVDRDVEGYVPRYARITVKATDMKVMQ